MHILPYGIVRAAPRHTAIRSCRRIAGRRLPQSRSFKVSSFLKTRDESSTNSAATAANANHGSPELGASIRNNHNPAEPPLGQDASTEPFGTADDAPEGKPTEAEKTGKVADKRFYGSWRKRATRGNPESKIFVPDWFLDKNLKPWDPVSTPDAHLEIITDARTTENSDKLAHGVSNSTSQESGRPEETRSETSHVSNGMYQIDKSIMDEIIYMASAGLRITPNGRADDISESKPHLILQSPKDGAELYLELVVNYTATELGADLVSIDAQDIAEIALDNTDAIPESNAIALRNLGFDAHVVLGEDQYPIAEENESNEEFDDDAEDDDARGKPPTVRSSSAFPIHIQPLSHMIQSLFPPKIGGAKFIGAIGPVQIPSIGTQPGGLSGPFADRDTSSEPDAMVVIESFLDAIQTKRRTAKEKPAMSGTDSSEVLDSGPQSAGLGSTALIILIKDYLEMNATASGGAFLKGIHAAVGRRRRKGQPILIMGATSCSDLMPSMSKSGFRSLQTGSEQDNFRTIVVPCRSPDADSLFAEDVKLRTKNINCRNITALLRQLGSEPQQVAQLALKDDLGFRSEQVFAWGLDENVWTFDKVERTASMALGLLGVGESMTAEHLDRALKILESSDDSKFAWLDLEREKSLVNFQQPDSNSSKNTQSNRIKQLHKSCNRHEKKLLNGVIDASAIATTFGEVHAPESTIEALKTLTSLSLIRPDAFKYGVLATDKIPGLLLYGPPGTGKTLLAKAVAKECGATVLEIAGSDVYDMYVGEGEKNVRAIFTLAKKLSPCIVFIDEADAIFGSRSTSTNRTSHRELINQFLREWDGMNDLSAFIMVATNRPFDLDDAVLRRLPRRILVDLPTEKDREAILQIHLKDEVLDSNVSLSAIASRTPFYSGSDLKNMSVAAAMACVRDENDEAAKHSGSEPYAYPEKRTLTESHFDRAMSEISASISEDMSSLAAIRKFDEKYGDRRGRRKKLGGWGFGNLTESEREKLKSEEGRVRSPEVGA